jgi:hypothetical protein
MVIMMVVMMLKRGLGMVVPGMAMAMVHRRMVRSRSARTLIRQQGRGGQREQTQEQGCDELLHR